MTDLERVVEEIAREHVPRVGPPDGTHYCMCGQRFGWATTWAAHLGVLIAARGEQTIIHWDEGPDPDPVWRFTPIVVAGEGQ